MNRRKKKDSHTRGLWCSSVAAMKKIMNIWLPDQLFNTVTKMDTRIGMLHRKPGFKSLYKHEMKKNRNSPLLLTLILNCRRLWAKFALVSFIDDFSNKELKPVFKYEISLQTQVKIFLYFQQLDKWLSFSHPCMDIQSSRKLRKKGTNFTFTTTVLPPICNIITFYYTHAWLTTQSNKEINSNLRQR